MDQLDAVCPIFCEREDERLFQVGSGVLIEFRGCFFLLTAAHVIDELKDADLLVPHANNVIKSIEGAYSYISPSVNRAEDFLDYGYFKLDTKFISGLKEHFYFVKEHDLGVEKSYARRELFSFVGFPHRKSNTSGEQVSTDCFSYGTYHAELSEYKLLEFEQDANIVTKFNRKNSFNLKSGRVELPVLPHGISGGGVFIWPKNILETPPKNRKLVGIGHTWNAKGYFIATRIEIFLEAILRNNPSLRYLNLTSKNARM
ncbi:hypothetical protein [Neptunomonas antarctica]|uniref:Trypsin-like peptidase domain-containing protein n=1 Tax=Neptunomonas antarctica TaxID=619304 RepID=A0A1N7PII4_9GAMM|nr:hypothetical protein [Neptunomonas antarctica]SIT10401.1 hypothetical protein SAMN05421760_11536 [Neptunomonas antarctica]